jgi:hypothetical protein
LLQFTAGGLFRGQALGGRFVEEVPGLLVGAQQRLDPLA